MTPHILASGSEVMASLASQIVQYTGGDTRFGRRVRIGAAATLLAIALHTVVIIGVSGSPGCCKKKKKRSAIQENLRNVGKAVAGDAAVESKTDHHEDFDEYDVVIVGGGTAGCVLASRLSIDPKVRVLLLEAGGNALENPLVRTPSGFSLIFGTPLVFNLFTTPQQGSGDRAHYWPRAKMLGGCSSINAQICHHGDPSDFDEWARLAGEGAESWAYKDFHKYLRKFEKFVPSKAHPGVNTVEHGSDGPVEVGFHDNYSPITQRFMEACTRVGIPSLADFNTPRGTVGVAKFMTFVDSNGRRVSMDSAYLTPEVLSRPNLTVAVNASATRIIFDTSGSSPRAIGVEFASSKDSPRFRVRAKKEVILSAGALHSPHILMLSGIGPVEHLTEHKIPVIAALPGVGEHMMDHAVVDVAVADTSGTSLTFLRPTTFWHRIKRMHAILTYTLTGVGPLTCIVAEAAAFFRSSDPALFPQHTAAPPAHTEDSTHDRHAPDLEFFSSPFAYCEAGKGVLPETEMLGLHMVLLRPTSKGNLRLQSSDPFQHPLIDPKYLSTEHDLTVLERGMAILNRVMHASPLADIIDHSMSDKRLGQWLPTANLTELRAYVRSHLETLFHPTSTARMAPLSDGGVVDPRLRVYGVQGLRVVDASVFPTITSGHTACPTIAVAEKAADLILEDLARSSSVA